MSDLEQWAEDHAKRAKLEETMHAIRNMWKSSGVGKTLLMAGPVYEQVVVAFDLGRDEGSVPSVILPGEVQQKQQQEQKDGSEGTAEVHDAKPG